MLKRFLLLIMGITYTASTLPMTLTHYVENIETVSVINKMLDEVTNNMPKPGPISSTLSNIANYITSEKYVNDAAHVYVGTLAVVGTAITIGGALYLAYLAFTDDSKPTPKPVVPTANQDRISIDIA